MKTGALLGRLTAFLFPRKCVGCRVLLDWYEFRRTGEVFCPDCREKWEAAKREVCDRCARRIGSCTCVKPTMERARSRTLSKLVYYRHAREAGIEKKLIFHIKRTRDRRTEAFLARELMPAIERLRNTCGEKTMVLTYLPRTRSAKLEYGTDQAEALALALSEASGIPLERLILRHRGKNKQQKQLSLAARLRNAEESFYIVDDAELGGKVVLLVDDIVTSGASMAVGTRLLRRAGVKDVHCLSVAETDPAMPL